MAFPKLIKKAGHDTYPLVLAVSTGGLMGVGYLAWLSFRGATGTSPRKIDDKFYSIF